MDFIPEIEYPLPLLFGFAALLIVAVLLGIVLSVLWRLRPAAGSSVRASVLPTLTALAGMVGFLGMFATVFGFGLYGAVEREKQFSEQVEATYGLDLDQERIGELGYPEERPEADFKTFGSAEIVEQSDTQGEYTGTKVYLIWEDGKMILAKTTDGESFEAIEPRKS